MAELQEVPAANGLPLSGVIVVDLSRLVSGNVLTHVLADLGADVIKVEPPGKGNEPRAWQHKGISTCWLAYGRNKHSVSVDLRSPEGRTQLQALLAQADVHTADGRALSIHARPYKINGKRPPLRRGAPEIGQYNERWLSQRPEHAP